MKLGSFSARSFSEMAFSVAMLTTTALVAVSCTNDSEQRKPSVNEVTLASYKLQHLQNTLTPGSTKKAVLEEFGEPRERTRHDDGFESWTYETRKVGQRLNAKTDTIGFQVLFKKDMLVRWSPILTADSIDEIEINRDSAVTSSVPPSSRGERASGALEVFRLFGNPSEAKTIPLREIVGFGFVTQIPDLKITNIVAIEVSHSNPKPGESTIVIGLNAYDSESLKKFTEQNVGKRILVSSGTEQIAVPFITAPLDTTSFQLIVETADADRVLKHLGSLKAR